MIFFLGILLLVVLFLLLVLLAGFFFYAIDALLDLPYVATKRNKIETIIKLAKIKKGETVVDLGSGDGRLLIAAALSGAHAIGYEINPYLVLFTKLKSQLTPAQVRGLISTKRTNLWKADLKIADVIFVYGRTKSMQKFEDFIFKNARPGTKVVVNTDKTTPFPTKRPEKSINGIFLYKT